MGKVLPPPGLRVALDCSGLRRGAKTNPCCTFEETERPAWSVRFGFLVGLAVELTFGPSSAESSIQHNGEEQSNFMSYVEDRGALLVSPRCKLPPEAVIFGRSQAMQALREKLQKAAATSVPVLISGESGTGKEILCNLLHHWSPWKDGPFVKVTCPAIPSTLLESELFGYEQGAFTGAYGTKPGRVEMAHRGTLFLDEIAELDLALQAKLLHLLQDGQFSRIGGQEDRRVEVRIVSATSRELKKEVAAGAFRQDLFYRINVICMHLPPLRERRGDIPELVSHFLAFYSAAFKTPARPVPGLLTRLLENYDWPGNIRQLENLIKRYVILGSEEAICCDLVIQSPAPACPGFLSSGPTSLTTIIQEAVPGFEREFILKALEAHHWNRKKAARALGVSYRALLYKIRQTGLKARVNP